MHPKVREPGLVLIHSYTRLGSRDRRREQRLRIAQNQCDYEFFYLAYDSCDILLQYASCPYHSEILLNGVRCDPLRDSNIQYPTFNDEFLGFPELGTPGCQSLTCDELWTWQLTKGPGRATERSKPKPSNESTRPLWS